MSDPPLVRLVPLLVPLPRRTALVPVLLELEDDPAEDDDPPRDEAELVEPLDEELELPEPEELEPLEGGADRTGCCSE